jgi:hypothetical protein
MHSCEMALHNTMKYSEAKAATSEEPLVLEQYSMAARSSGVGDEKVCLLGRKWRPSMVS